MRGARRRAASDEAIDETEQSRALFLEVALVADCATGHGRRIFRHRAILAIHRQALHEPAEEASHEHPGRANVVTSHRHELRQMREHLRRIHFSPLPRTFGPQALDALPDIAGVFSIVEILHAAGCANPVITYEPDLMSFLIRIRLFVCASSSRSLKVL